MHSQQNANCRRAQDGCTGKPFVELGSCQYTRANLPANRLLGGGSDAVRGEETRRGRKLYAGSCGGEITESFSPKDVDIISQPMAISK